ncbi:MAG: O-antigen ligase family protein [Oscillospiraceae bacterium]|jgi:hypothetical protein|nr:O-antigen ligase family protein [Oscillospiraceae bacterium]
MCICVLSNSIFLKKIKSEFGSFSLFRRIYIISLLFETLSITETPALWLKSFVLFLGLFLFFGSFFSTPEKFKIKHVRFVLFFLIVGILTSFINMSADFLTNLIFVFHNFICFFVFFGMKENTQKKYILDEINFVFNFIILFSLILSIIGLTTLFFNSGIKFNGYVFGVFKNRFFGICTNPNLSGFLSVISIFVCDCMLGSTNEEHHILRGFLKKTSQKHPKHNNFFPFFFSHHFEDLFGQIVNHINNKLVLQICIILNIFVLFLSDSNASFVFINIYIIVKVFYNSFLKYESIKDTKILREVLFLFVCVVMIISGSVLMRVVSQKTVNFAINICKNSSKKTPEEQIILEEILDNFDSKTSAGYKIGRENYDISSGRIYLFKQGIELFKIYPLIGIGRANLVRYGRLYLDGGLIFSDLHNSYLTILVSYGTIGFLFFLIFFICVMKDMCRKFLKLRDKHNSAIFYKFFSFLVSYISYSIFEKAILSEMTFMVVFFWMILGYAVAIEE